MDRLPLPLEFATLNIEPPIIPFDFDGVQPTFAARLSISAFRKPVS